MRKGGRQKADKRQKTDRKQAFQRSWCGLPWTLGWHQSVNNGAIAVVSLFLLTSTALAQPSQEGILKQATPVQLLAPSLLCPAQLPGSIDGVINRLPAVRWGILVQTLGVPASRSTLYARNPDTLLIPASNNKFRTYAKAILRDGFLSC